jgi:ubiquinone/menaquinone biosynthesis C-methylase UbiE
LGRAIRFLDNFFYKNTHDNWDHKIFQNEIMENLGKEMIILDIGAGAGNVQEMNFRGLAGQVYGIDPDPRVLNNPHLDQAYIGYGESMAMFAENYFDMVICCNVLEHLNDPTPFFLEINRVLKKGGLLLTKTPNKRHYVPLIARITPTIVHQKINKIRGRIEEDTFPTFYHVNTKKTQVQAAEKTGFELVEINFYEGRPEYLRFNFITYLLGILFERTINKLGLDLLKVVIISKFRKKRLIS